MIKLSILVAALTVACGTTKDKPGGGGGGGGNISNKATCEDVLIDFEGFLASCFPDDFSEITEAQARAECDDPASSLAGCIPVIEAWTACAEEAGCNGGFDEPCWDQFRALSVCIGLEDPGLNPPCQFANDGVCDEPTLCDPGTDGTDCAPPPPGPGEEAPSE